MGPMLIPALILIALFVIAFVAWELLFARKGQRSMVEQNRAEGHDEPPKNF